MTLDRVTPGRGGAPAASGGGGILDRAEKVNVAGNFVPPNSSGGWLPLAFNDAADMTLTLLGAEPGDLVEVGGSALRSTAASVQLDVAVRVGGSTVRYVSSQSATPLFEGPPSWYPNPDADFQAVHGSTLWLPLEAGDIVDGAVVLAMVAKAPGSQGTIYASAAYPFRWWANLYRLAA